MHCGRLRPPSQLTSQPLTGFPVWLRNTCVEISGTGRDKRGKWRTHSWQEATCEHLWWVLLCGVLLFSLFALLNPIKLFPEPGLPSLPRPLSTCQLAAKAEPGVLGGGSRALQQCLEFPSALQLPFPRRLFQESQCMKGRAWNHSQPGDSVLYTCWDPPAPDWHLCLPAHSAAA